MLNFKKIIADKINEAIKIDNINLEEFLEVPKDTSNGDYSFPCFKLAKNLKKSPQAIAEDIKEKINIENSEIEKVEIVGGYLNFFINKEILAKEVLTEIANKEEYGKSNLGEGKTILVEYSSPNIAKQFHIGHLRTTLIGKALYNVYKYLGYNTIGINHLGDYGTQFGKMIEGYKMWGDEYDLNENPIEKLTDIYVRINELCKKDEKVLASCRDNFRKLEEKDPYCVELWNRFKDLSLKEFDKIYNLLDVKFDSMKGEAFYSDKLEEVENILENTGKLKESQGAKIIDLEDRGISAPCIIKKSDGSSIYATRDLAAILYRARTYNYDKCLYDVAYEQILHFKQVFEVAKLLGLDKKYTDGLEHVAFGMVHLSTGKMSTREGNVIKVEELLKESIERAEKIISEKNPNLENKEEIAKKVGIGAVVFNDLSSSRIKDEIFDWDLILNFQGETGPYIQYMYVRTKSVLEKVSNIPNIRDINFELLCDECSQEILKLLYNFEDILIDVTNKNEPSILSHYLINLAKAYSTFYNNNRIIGEEEKIQNARVYLSYATNKVLKKGAELLGIHMPEKM